MANCKCNQFLYGVNNTCKGNTNYNTHQHTAIVAALRTVNGVGKIYAVDIGSCAHNAIAKGNACAFNYKAQWGGWILQTFSSAVANAVANSNIGASKSKLTKSTGIYRVKLNGTPPVIEN